MSYSRILFLIITLVQGSAHAATVATPSDFERVSGDFLKIVGRGLQDQNTHDVIALACVAKNLINLGDPSCREVRHVLLKSKTKEMFYLHKTYSLESESEPSNAKLTELVREINSSFKHFKKNENETTRGKMFSYSVLGATVAIGSAVIIRNSQISNKEGPVIGLIPGLAGEAIFMGAVFGVQSLIQHTTAPESGFISNAMIDQSGWNWSVEPKRISSKHFALFQKYLSSFYGNPWSNRDFR